MRIATHLDFAVIRHGDFSYPWHLMHGRGRKKRTREDKQTGEWVVDVPLDCRMAEMQLYRSQFLAGIGNTRMQRCWGEE